MTLAWTLFIIYLVFTTWLGWVGFKKTKDFSSFAIGTGDLKPYQVGITLAAATASAATFIINPGFIYVDGLAAFMHYGISVYFGILCTLFFLSFKFRELGEKMKALTIPDWVGKRYKSKGLSLYFSIVNLLSFAFIVLLVGGVSIVMQKLLGVNNVTALLITLIFVTGYVLMGGTYAHVYTNMFQGMLMIGVSLLVVFSGITVMSEFPDYWEFIRQKDENLLKWVNPSSRLYSDYFSVYISGFLIGGALVCQPHILTKALYVKTDDAVRKYIYVFAGVYILFTLLLLAGFWAHGIVDPVSLTDPATGSFRQDLVMTVYLEQAFPDWLFTIISIVLLAAAMSTLDGLLVGISTITANDLVLTLVEKFRNGKMTSEEELKLAYRVSHIVLIILAVLVFFVTLNPPELLGIFGQVGVYGLVVAVVPALVLGVMYEHVEKNVVWIASIAGLLVHGGLYFYGRSLFPDSNLAFANPGLTAAIALLVIMIPSILFTKMKN